ncbi:MAG: rhodanese-like domain-containing protein [Opitutaceae bacterium]|jgi:rhodanese-related sulfurtransferase
MSKTILAALACLSLAVIASAASPQVTDISQDELKAAIAAKSATILDVNGSQSYGVGHIPGAIDFLAHKQEIARLLPADKGALIVAYCGDIHCTAYRQAAYAALDLGYTNVKHFAPGIKGWRESGERTEAGGN